MIASLWNHLYGLFHRGPLNTGCRFAIPLFGMSLIFMILTGCSQSAAQALPLTSGSPTATRAMQQQTAVVTDAPVQAPNLPQTQVSDTQLSGPGPTLTPTILAGEAIIPNVTLAPLPTWPARQTGPVSALLYLSKDRLLLWDPRLEGSQPLAEKVTSFAASANGQVVAYLRSSEVTANGRMRYDLELRNLQTSQTITLLGESPPLLQLALSPHGDWVAYRVDVEGGPIYALDIDEDGQVGEPVRVGDCSVETTGDCSHLGWSPDNEGLVWSDSRGIWLSAPAQSKWKARLVYPAEVSVVDPKGNTSRMAVHFSQPDWFMNGRFVLLHVQPNGSTVSWYALLDTLRSKLAQVPDSYAATPQDSSVRWMPDGKLLVTHSSEPLRRIPPYMRLIRVNPASTNMLVIEKAFDLYSDAIPFSDSTRKIIPTHSLDWPGYVQDGRMPLGINLIGADTAPVLFQLELQFGRLTKLADLPADVIQIYWSPDGRHGLLIHSDGKNARLISFPAREQIAFYDLLPVLGPEPHSFLWLAPALRP